MMSKAMGAFNKTQRTNIKWWHQSESIAAPRRTLEPQTAANRVCSNTMMDGLTNTHTQRKYFTMKNKANLPTGVLDFSPSSSVPPASHTGQIFCLKLFCSLDVGFLFFLTLLQQLGLWCLQKKKCVKASGERSEPRASKRFSCFYCTFFSIRTGPNDPAARPGPARPISTNRPSENFTLTDTHPILYHINCSREKMSHFFRKVFLSVWVFRCLDFYLTGTQRRLQK